jgi:hypothetical protein
MHNDAVAQGLSEVPAMQDVEKWGIFTIGTGLGNALFVNRTRRKATAASPNLRTLQEPPSGSSHDTRTRGLWLAPPQACRPHRCALAGLWPWSFARKRPASLQLSPPFRPWLRTIACDVFATASRSRRSRAFRTRIYPRRDDGTEFLLGPRSGPAARAGMPCPAHEVILCHVLP